VLLNRIVLDDRGQSRPELQAARRCRVDQCARDRDEPVRLGIFALVPRVDLDVPDALDGVGHVVVDDDAAHEEVVVVHRRPDFVIVGRNVAVVARVRRMDSNDTAG
jgi:hypothetical protein